MVKFLDNILVTIFEYHIALTWFLCFLLGVAFVATGGRFCFFGCLAFGALGVHFTPKVN